MVAQFLLEALCCFIVEFATAGAAAGLSASNPLTDLSTSENRRPDSRSSRCAVDGCNTLSFRSTDYCWRHQDETASAQESEADTNWWEEKTE
ncbi:MAG: hypothetical protein CM1200mP21_06040 [Candidatus Poseidoniales archaeon]|nr:MAG: hypothetical protein CM1200mP21_06040 [Candidatus Poseidoniales archaeon]